MTEIYPNIVVNMEVTTFGNYWDKFQADLASGSAPDIVALQSLRTAEFASRRAFEPLNSFIKETPEFNIDDFEQSILDGLKWAGNQVAIPYDFGPYVLYYNKEIFDKCDVDYPDENMTWEDFLEKAKATSGDGTYGFVFNNNSFDQFVPWMWSNGGNYIDVESGKCMIQEPEATEAIQFLADLVHKHKAAAPFTDPGNGSWCEEQFYAGKAAMYMDGPWNFVAVRSKAKFDWDITTIPSGKEGSKTWVAGSGFGISASSKHKEEAWKALTVILGEEGQKYLAQTGRAYPGRKSAAEEFMKVTEKPENLEAVKIAASKAEPFKTTVNWGEITSIMTRELDHVWINNAPAKEVTKRLKDMLDPLIEEHMDITNK